MFQQDKAAIHRTIKLRFLFRGKQIGSVEFAGLEPQFTQKNNLWQTAEKRLQEQELLLETFDERVLQVWKLMKNLG